MECSYDLIYNTERKRKKPTTFSNEIDETAVSLKQSPPSAHTVKSHDNDPYWCANIYKYTIIYTPHCVVYIVYIYNKNIDRLYFDDESNRWPYDVVEVVSGKNMIFLKRKKKQLLFETKHICFQSCLLHIYVEYRSVCRQWPFDLYFVSIIRWCHDSVGNDFVTLKMWMASITMLMKG